MQLLTLDYLERHVETDLGSIALQMVIDAEEAEVIRRYGPHDSAVEQFPGRRRRLQLTRYAESITTVNEDGNELDAEDYALRSRFVLERIGRDWGHWVTVTYAPEDQISQRRHVLIQLCKLALLYKGHIVTSSGGDFSTSFQAGTSYGNYSAERERLLASLAPRGGLFV